MLPIETAPGDSFARHLGRPLVDPQIPDLGGVAGEFWTSAV
jgi:hypothetical protein